MNEYETKKNNERNTGKALSHVQSASTVDINDPTEKKRKMKIINSDGNRTIVEQRKALEKK